MKWMITHENITMDCRPNWFSLWVLPKDDQRHLPNLEIEVDTRNKPHLKGKRNDLSKGKLI